AEAAHVAIIRLLGSLGRRREASEEYDRCRRILEAELRAAPSAVLEAARMALDAGPSAASAGEVRASPSAEPPRATIVAEPEGKHGLVGRASERAILRAALHEASNGEAPPPHVLSGEPGVGKTRLVEELISAARAAGGLTLVGRAFEA